jgi:hypothetical protein
LLAIERQRIGNRDVGEIEMAGDEPRCRLSLVTYDHVDTQRSGGAGQLARKHVCRGRNIPDDPAEPKEAVYASHAPQDPGQMTGGMARRPERDEGMPLHQRLRIGLVEEGDPMPASDKLIREGEHRVQVPEKRRGYKGEVGQGSRSLRAQNLENCRTRGYALTITLP